jgi:hypothetical protein
LNKSKDKPGFIGVKAHPFWHRSPPAELLPVAVELANIGKPMGPMASKEMMTCSFTAFLKSVYREIYSGRLSCALPFLEPVAPEAISVHGWPDPERK